MPLDKFELLVQGLLTNLKIMYFSNNFVAELKHQMSEGKLNKYICPNNYLHQIKEQEKGAFVTKDKVIKILKRNLFPYQTEIMKSFLYHEENLHTSCETLNLAEVLIHYGNKWEAFHIYSLPEYFYTTKRRLEMNNLKVSEILPSVNSIFWAKELGLKIKPEIKGYKQKVFPVLKPVMYEEYLQRLSSKIEPLEGFDNFVECLLYLNWISRHEDKFILNQEI